jgi:hypothetical protein
MNSANHFYTALISLRETRVVRGKRREREGTRREKERGVEVLLYLLYCIFIYLCD